MKKQVQIAFTIVLVILSVVGSIWSSDTIRSIIYVIILPSFFLSAISFVSEISEECGNMAHNSSIKAFEIANASQAKGEKDMEAYKSGKYSIPYASDCIPKEISDELKKASIYREASFIAHDVTVVFDKCKRICDIINLVCYILLFLSLIFSAHIVRFLSNVDLNCISLWSLTLLFVTLELKKDIRRKIYNIIVKCMEKRQKATVKSDKK